MNSKKLVFRTFIRQPVDAVFRWHLRSNSILRGFPSWGRWLHVKEEELEGHQFRMVYKRRGLFRWKTVVFRLRFDRQRNMFFATEENGKLKKLSVTIELRAHSIDACEMVERIEFLLKWPWFFGNLREKILERVFKIVFSFRQETLMKDLEFFQNDNMPEKQRILISGAKGMVGSSLRVFLQSMGHEVCVLTREKTKNETDVFFDDRTGEIERDKLENFDAIVHLRGQKIFTRWSKKKKDELVSSRVDATKRLAHHLALLNSPPKAFLCASAVGFYGNRGPEKLDEKSESGKGAFLSQLASDWEDASKILIRKNVRVVYLRFGLILSMGGGALVRMAWPIRLGLPGVLGHGKQFTSWIALDDAIGAITHCMSHNEIAGPVNIVSPNPITNLELSASIAKHYNKQLWGKVPEAAIRLFTAEMGEELLLSSARCFPKVLTDTGYRFRYPFIDKALSRLMIPNKETK